MEKIKIGLVNVGESLPVSLRLLADTLNGIQGAYTFTETEPIPCDVLGNPGVHLQ